VEPKIFGMGGAMVNLEVIEGLAIALKNMYDAFSNQFYSQNIDLNQLKSLKRVKLTTDDPDWNRVSAMIDSYMTGLSELGNEKLTQLQTVFDFQYRIKLQTTILLKIKVNMDKHLYVAKVLNDFFGARVVLTGIEGQQYQLDQLLQNLKRQGIISRYYTRSDGQYRATHCYFQTDNRYFPWELQIWDTLREKQNQLEHIRHEKERHR